jgi:hypothetical protein
MAVSIEKRPESYWFDPGNTSGNVVALHNNGKVNIRGTAHGLADGAVVYVKSDVANYNGFFFVRLADANLFYIQTIEIPFSGSTDDCVDFIRETASVEYFGAAGGSIKWNAVHLPVVYKLSNDLWPINSVDTVRTISSVTDSSGYCVLSLSGDIKATGSAAALEFIKITGATDDDLNGVWQITSYTNDTTFTIAIPYSSANDTALTSASIQYYYNNYHVNVRVYGGLKASHIYASEEPYTLLATLSLIPDSDNLVVFSVSEILKKNIRVKNNLLLGTMPNNLDAFTMFYIEYAEVYDDSDGTTLGTTTPSYSSDQSTFEGYAVNAKLPFKNIFSGTMSEYASANTNQKFLTLFDTPVIFSGKYFDLSFIFDNKTEVLEFSNTAFTATINNWTNFNGSNRSTQQTFAWNSDGGNGAALADATIGGAENTKYFAAQRPAGGQWPSGTYVIAIRAKNSSVGDADSISVGFWGMDNSTSQLTLSATGTSTFPRDSTYYIRALTFTTTKPWNYIAFEFTRNGGGGTFDIVAYVDNISIMSGPGFEDSFPLLKQEYFNGNTSTGTADVELDDADSGVYRAQITDPSCSNTSIQTELYSVPKYGMSMPSSWTNVTSTFDSKTDTQFTEAVTGSVIIQVYDALPVDVDVDEVFHATVTVTVTGTWTGQLTVSMFLTNAANAPRSSPLTTDNNIFTINGTYTIHYILQGITSAASRAHLQLLTTVTSGTANVAITTPLTYYVVPTTAMTETKAIDINCDCLRAKATGYYLSWLNYLGGFDYWYFTAYADNIIDITESEETEENIFPEWPNSYGEFADTITKQTFRNSREQVLVRSQHITQAQLQAIKHIKTSPLVQIVNSIYDRRTVIVDADSFTYLKEGSNLYEISFTITYTDDVPSQRV